MGKIQVLSQAVADQIAAGEVAERPSAVVKELVENAIDAGADRIDVEIKKGGVAYIRVTDNGCGIPAQEAETAFLRHATSKLTQIADLDRLGTMGFRGEALASICAVARVEMITKTPEAEEGLCLELVHGKTADRQPIACANGTTVVVRDLFANVPARMKFLKKDASEAGYVADILGRIALSRPEIAFSYVCDGKEIFATGGDGNLANVVLKLYGLDHAKALIPVDYTEDGIHISGVIGKPELARGNRTRQTLFVNGRYVKNHVVGKVVEEAYRNSIMTGRFPFFVISVDMAAELVDVNVHPAKTEIKFANEKQVYDVAYHAVRNALYSGENEKTKEIPQRPAAPKGNFAPAFGRSGTERREPERVSPSLVRKYMENTIPKEPEHGSGAKLREPENLSPGELLDKMLDKEIGPVSERETVPEEEAKPLPETGGSEQQAMPGLETESPGEPIRVLGQVFDTYIVCQCGQEMYLVDQHAAHERLRFEKLREAYVQKERLCQMLLSPLILKLDYREKEAILENRDRIQSFGFALEDFGSNAVIIHGTPIPGDEQTIRDLLLELAEAMGEQRRRPVADFEERALDMISCKYAIKANHRLSLQEMQDLVQRVWEMETEGVRTCPHGRPVRISFSKTEIEKLFKRRV